MVKFQSKLLFLIGLLTGFSSVANARTVLGRWCDQMIPGSNTMNRVTVIEITSTGGVVSRSELYDGSTSMDELTDIGAGIFEIVDSPYGDRYRLVDSTGELQLLDSDGLIRVARRLAEYTSA